MDKANTFIKSIETKIKAVKAFFSSVGVFPLDPVTGAVCGHEKT